MVREAVGTANDVLAVLFDTRRRVLVDVAVAWRNNEMELSHFHIHFHCHFHFHFQAMVSLGWSQANVPHAY